jgi:hypothetical protein
MNSMALAFVTSPPLLMMNSMKNKFRVCLDIIDETHAPFPWDLIGS